MELLKLIQAYFGGIGRIGKERNDCCDFTVSSRGYAPKNKYYIRTAYIIIGISNKIVFVICMINLRAKDVYDGIPTVVTTFVAIIPKISIFIFLLELVHYTSQSIFEFN